MKNLDKMTSVPEMKPLNFFVGKWRTEGEIVPDGSDPARLIRGIDTYEWVSGGFFLLHRVEVMMGNERTDVIEIIGGYDLSSNAYPMRSFDNQGNFVTMKGYFEKPDVFKIQGEGMRSELVVSKSGDTMTARWEQSTDGIAWKPWITMTLTKQME
jgi:hypothetical protein